MKKFLTGFMVLSVAFASFSAALPQNKAFAAFIMEEDAQTAMEKNQKAVEAAFNKANITNDTTKDDIENIIVQNCSYSASESDGVGLLTEGFVLNRATATKAGFVQITVMLYQDDGEVGFVLKKEISALGGTETEEESGEADENDIESETVSENPKQEIADAKKAINAAIWDYDVSNDTTQKDVLNMAKNALPNGSNVKISLASSDFSITKATTKVNGTVSARFVLKCGDMSDTCAIGKTIELVITEDYEKLKDDKHLIGAALKDLVYSNRLTADDVLKTAAAAAKNGSKVTLKGDFMKKRATFYENGDITFYLTFDLGEETDEIRVNEVIPKLVHKIPSDKISVNQEEWDILARTNRERAKEKVRLLSMAGALQTACDVREDDLEELFSHTRPDGTKYYTAIPEDFKPKGSGENIHSCPGHTTAEQSMEGWMNSEGHRKNILTESYDLIGTGITSNNAVQIFAIWNSYIESVTTSSGSMQFEDEDAMMKEYLICKYKNGLETYMPLDAEAMTKVDGGYSVYINSENPVVIKIGNGSAASEVNADKKDNETKKTNDVSFKDVSSDAYYANAVKWAVERNITTGTSQTTFSPDETCTRAQILTFLWRAVGSPETNAANPFSDVKKSDYYYGAALWASEKGMVKGNKFEGETPCLRSSTVTYLWQNSGSPEAEKISSFEDVSASAEYAKAVSWAVENGVTSGTSATEFSPNEICSRGQIVTFLNRAIK